MIRTSMTSKLGGGCQPWPVQRSQFLALGRRQIVGHTVSHAVDQAWHQRHADPQMPDLAS